MRFKVNLSQRPFHNRKLFWLGFVFVIAASALFATWTLARVRETDTRVKELEAKINKQKQELATIQKQPIVKLESLTPQQIEQIRTAATLISQRGFSWTRMLEEFERALPDTIRIGNITMKSSEAKTSNTSLALNMQLHSKSVEDVTKLIAAMDKQGVFDITPKTQFAGENGEYTFTLEVLYKPRPRPPARPENDTGKSAGGDQYAKDRSTR